MHSPGWPEGHRSSLKMCTTLLSMVLKAAAAAAVAAAAAAVGRKLTVQLNSVQTKTAEYLATV